MFSSTNHHEQANSNQEISKANVSYRPVSAIPFSTKQMMVRKSRVRAQQIVSSGNLRSAI